MPDQPQSLPTSSPREEPIRVFVSYAREDRKWIDPAYAFNLIPFLEDSLRRQGVTFWYDHNLKPGDEFKRFIETEIDTAQIAVLLVSQSFLNSEFIEEHEMPRIHERAKTGDMIVVPVLVGPCKWSDYPFLADRQMVPTSSALIKYTLNEAQWEDVKFDILEGLREQIKRIREGGVQKRVQETLAAGRRQKEVEAEDARKAATEAARERAERSLAAGSARAVQPAVAFVPPAFDVSTQTRGSEAVGNIVSPKSKVFRWNSWKVLGPSLAFLLLVGLTVYHFGSTPKIVPDQGTSLRPPDANSGAQPVAADTVISPPGPSLPHRTHSDPASVPNNTHSDPASVPNNPRSDPASLPSQPNHDPAPLAVQPQTDPGPALTHEELEGLSGKADEYYDNKKFAEAIPLYTRTCANDLYVDCVRLGYMYEMGKGVTVDAKQAVGLYRKGCNGGDAHSCFNLGLMYENGTGVTKDNNQAVSLYRKGCDGGPAHSCSDLAYMFENGKGVEKDNGQAIILYRKGCKGGDQWGCDQLKRLGH